MSSQMSREIKSMHIQYHTVPGIHTHISMPVPLWGEKGHSPLPVPARCMCVIRYSYNADAIKSPYKSTLRSPNIIAPKPPLPNPSLLLEVERGRRASSLLLPIFLLDLSRHPRGALETVGAEKKNIRRRIGEKQAFSSFLFRSRPRDFDWIRKKREGEKIYLPAKGGIIPSHLPSQLETFCNISL